MRKSKWTTDNIPDQTGKVVIITGATSGLGKEAARVLAGKNSTVVMAVRNTDKGEEVASEIRRQYPAANIEISVLDLGSLASVKAFTDRFIEDHDRLDVLINNAGVMFCHHSRTEDGFEMQIGTNHFGHFALTGRLMPLLRRTSDSRIVATGSMAYKGGNIDFSDVNWERRKYSAKQAYYDSKMANLYFAYELARRSEGDSNAPRVAAAHPGWTRSGLQRRSGLTRVLSTFLSQGPDMGVLPTLRSAYDPQARPGDYYGPSGFLEMHGNPVLVKSNALSHDREAAAKLWELSEQLTGVSFRV